jgi:hypothetical protein
MERPGPQSWAFSVVWNYPQVLDTSVKTPYLLGMAKKPFNYANVRQQISANGALPPKRQPTAAQLDYLASLIVKGVENGVFAWDLSPEGWGGREAWQVSKMIDSFKKQVED